MDRSSRLAVAPHSRSDHATPASGEIRWRGHALPDTPHHDTAVLQPSRQMLPGRREGERPHDRAEFPDHRHDCLTLRIPHDDPPHGPHEAVRHAAREPLSATAETRDIGSDP